MGKEISVYSLANGVTDEQYLKYVKDTMGPFLESLPSVRRFELVRIKGEGEVSSTYVVKSLRSENRRVASLRSPLSGILSARM